MEYLILTIQKLVKKQLRNGQKKKATGLGVVMNPFRLALVGNSRVHTYLT